MKPRVLFLFLLKSLPFCLVECFLKFVIGVVNVRLRLLKNLLHCLRIFEVCLDIQHGNNEGNEKGIGCYF